MADKQQISEKLSQVIDPHLDKDILSLGFVKEVELEGTKAIISIELPPPVSPERNAIKDKVKEVLLTLPDIKDVDVDLKIKLGSEGQHSHQAPPKPLLAPQVKNIIPVASGKGGVGKSTVSANLAIALSELGFKVGLMDADVYGPSIPILMGANEKPLQQDGKIIPPVCHGIKIISMGFFLPKDDAVIWRGPMLHKMIEQFLGQVEWGELDYLVIDLPPGTGDVHLSLCQSIPLTGAVIVSTPQDLAFHVAEKAVIMFKKLNTPVIGLIENMIGDIFGKGGASTYAASKGIPVLGEIPLSKELRIQSDQGVPIVKSDPESEVSLVFKKIAEKLTEYKANSLSELQEISLPTDKQVKVVWVDGSEQNFKAFDLRAACACAECVDEVSGERRINKEQLDSEVSVKGMEKVGSYGVRFDWSDGHGTGIYTYEYLKSLK